MNSTEMTNIAVAFNIQPEEMKQVKSYFLEKKGGKEMINALMIIGPTASMLGISVFTTISLLSNLEDTAIKATDLRRSFIDLAKKNIRLKRG